MKILRDIRRFVLCKSAEGNHREVREYVTENLDALACALRVPTDTLLTALQSECDNGALCTKLLETLRRAEVILRRDRRETRMLAAQALADALARSTFWCSDRVEIDMPSLFAAVLTHRDDLLVFDFDDGTVVAVYQAPLLDLSKIARVRVDLSGWVDRGGLHLRWGKAGGINLRPQHDPDARKIFVRLPSNPEERAA